MQTTLSSTIPITRCLLCALAIALAACSDECDFINVDESVRVTQSTPTELKFSITSIPSDITSRPRLALTVFGESEGLEMWVLDRGGDHGMHCFSESRDADGACGPLLDVTSNSSHSVWLQGQRRGAYELDLDLFDYREQASLLGSPVCTSQVRVRVE